MFNNPLKCGVVVVFVLRDVDASHWSVVKLPLNEVAQRKKLYIAVSFHISGYKGVTVSDLAH